MKLNISKKEMREYIEGQIEDLEDELDDALVEVQQIEKSIREAKSQLRGMNNG